MFFFYLSEVYKKTRMPEKYIDLGVLNEREPKHTQNTPVRTYVYKENKRTTSNEINAY